MKKSPKEEDGSYWYELTNKEVSDLVLKKYGGIIKPTEECEVIVDNGVAIMVNPKQDDKKLIDNFILRADSGWEDAIKKLPEIKKLNKESFKIGFIQGVRDVIIFIGKKYVLTPKFKSEKNR